MKKALTSLAAVTFLTTTTLNVMACGKDEYLEISINDITNPNGKPGNEDKIDKLAFDFIFNVLPEKEKTKYPIDYFKKRWSWIYDRDLENRIWKLHGSNNAGTIGEKTEYWKVSIKKSKNKNLFVSSYSKTEI